uniref:Tudor domain containing 15 n=1 Tax=Callorhinchus milii TaxID=7868 RepID=A0A4W3IGI4_CALMI
MENLMYSTFTEDNLNINLKVTCVECHPEKTLVRFWGHDNSLCELDYHILQNEIQNATKTKASFGTDELCFAEDVYNGGWYRGRLIRKIDELYEVFLIDVGKVLKVDARHVALACMEFFQLPPKVLCGIFANVVPIGGIWSSTAVNYFASLIASQLKGYVEDILLNHIILLEVTSVNKQLFELGSAKIFDSNTFRLVLEISEDFLDYDGCENTKLKHTSQLCSRAAFVLSSNFQPYLDVLTPSLRTGVVETVKITCASGPHRFYCQLKRLNPELVELTRDMYCFYESQENEMSDEPIENCGALCAAKGKDGRWHRGLVKRLLTRSQVEVWFIDYGNYDLVYPHYIRKLIPDFFIMPLMSFACALTDLPDKTKQWTGLQAEGFKQSLFEEAFQIHIDFYSLKEKLHYVTLCNHKNVSINQMYGTLSEGNIPEVNLGIEIGPKKEGNEDSYEQNASLSEETNYTTEALTGKSLSKPLKLNLVGSVGMTVDGSYLGFVEYVINPSDFWIRTLEYNCEFECLMKNITDHYSRIGINEELIQAPEPDLFCCARYYKDQHYYRAVITEVLGDEVRVCFIDFGNSEIVDTSDVKCLLPEYSKLPALAMNCSLAHVFPIEEVWTKNATDYFKKAVFNKQLFIEVAAKQDSRYVVNMKDVEHMEKFSISTLMHQAGYADFWNMQLDVNLPWQKSKLKKPEARRAVCTKSNTREHRRCIVKNINKEPVRKSCDIRISDIQIFTASAPYVTTNNVFPSSQPAVSRLTKVSTLVSPYLQQIFKLGSVLDVRVSHVVSPAEFWCQLPSKSNQLQKLMRKIQDYYSTPRDPFQFEHAVCVAKYSKDGFWYRVSIIERYFHKQELAVLFIDYGIQQRISRRNFCALAPEFLQLEGQAFRCTLNSIIQPVTCDPIVWDKVSCKEFNQFVDNALISGIGLKCTILSMALMKRKGLCNVIDLYTPFVSIGQLLVNKELATHVESSSSFSPLIQIYTHYYSSHGIKPGSEEKVFVTHVVSLAKFYCQLDKNTAVLDKLMIKINNISKMMHGQNLDMDKTSMCLAKYFEDGQWYRALVHSVKSPFHLKVFFIDYGNMQIVDKNDVLPIPEEASDLILIPMQAVKCCLLVSVDQEIPEEIVNLFKEIVIGKPLKALVIAKETGGQFIVELYDGNVKISAQIQHLLQHNRKVRCLENRWQIGKFHTLENTNYFSKLVKNKPHDCSMQLIKEINGPIKSYFRPKTHYIEKNPGTVVQQQDVAGKTWQNQSSRNHQSEDNLKLSLQYLVELNKKHYEEKLSKDGSSCSGQSEVNPKLPSQFQADVRKRRIKNNSEKTTYAGRRLKSYGKTGSSDKTEVNPSFNLDAAELENIANRSEVACITQKQNETYVNSSSGDSIQLITAEDKILHRKKKINSKGIPEVAFQNIQSIHMGDDDVEHKNGLDDLYAEFTDCSALSNELWSSETVSYFTAKVNPENLLCELMQHFAQLWNFHPNHYIGLIADNLNLENSKCSRSIEINKYFSKLKFCSDVKGPLGNNEYFKVKKSHTINVISKLCVINKKHRYCIDGNLLKNVMCARVISHYIETTNVVSALNHRIFSVLHTEFSPEELFALFWAVEGLERSKFLPLNPIEPILFFIKSSWYSQSDIAVIKLLNEETKMSLILFMDSDAQTILFWKIKLIDNNFLNSLKEIILYQWVGNDEIQHLLGKSVMSTIIFRIDHELIKLFRNWDSCLGDFVVIQNYFTEKYQTLILSKECSCDFNVGWLDGDEPYLECYSKTLMHSFDRIMQFPAFYSIAFITVQSETEYAAFAISVIDPSEFFIQLEDMFETMNTLSLLLAKLPENIHCLSQDLMIPGVGCLIRCTTDKEWRRAEISEISEDLVVARLVDYGHYVFIPFSELSRLKKLPIELAEIPRLAIYCSLSRIVPANADSWTDEAVLFFQESLNKNNLTVFFRQPISKLLWEVDVLINNKCVAKELVLVGHGMFIGEIIN